jgi:RNA polymerase sigma-70 factor (ECF subfamily)
VVRWAQDLHAYLATYAIGSPGDWRAIATAANGQPTVVAYHRDEAGGYRASVIVVLTVGIGGIARSTLSSDLRLLDRFGLPQAIAD